MTSDDHLDHGHLDHGSAGFNGDDYDPLIAERFALFDQVKAPAFGSRPLPRSVPFQPAEVRRINRFDPRYVLAAAAVVAVIAASSFVTLRGTGSELETNATNNDDLSVQTDLQDPTDNSAAVQDEASDDDKLTVEVTSSSTASVPAGANGEQTGETTTEADDPADESSGQSAQSGASENESDDQSDDDSTDTTNDGSTTTTTSQPEPATEEPATTTTLSKDSVLAPPTTKPPGSDTSLDIPGTSFPADGADRIEIIRGLLTEVFTDCRSHMALDEDGRIVNLDTVSCDGGSYIVVDGKMIRTSSGFVPSNRYYDRHNPLMRPGQAVVVSAVRSELLTNAWTLNCASCSITSGG